MSIAKSYDNLIDVMCMLDIYVDNNRNYVTVNRLYTYMKDEFDVSERTVRRSLDALLERGIVDDDEVGNIMVYVVDNREKLPAGREIVHLY